MVCSFHRKTGDTCFAQNPHRLFSCVCCWQPVYSALDKASALDRADRHTFDEVFLQEGIEQDDWQGGQDDDGGLDGDGQGGLLPHAAVVHYEAQPHAAVHLQRRGLLLLDSGAQYLCGTTDITRTIALGPVTPEERRAYTLVLKGHIGLSRFRFPEGTTGLQLDVAARTPIWQGGYDFGHGTGHGVGSHLCVHEGPSQIRKNVRQCTLIPFQVGQVVTNEPGIYVAGQFGVRIENMMLVAEAEANDFGRFLQFESLTLCPIDLRAADLSMLTPEEKSWLNDYHARVRQLLMPLLADEADRQWLDKATCPV